MTALEPRSAGLKGLNEALWNARHVAGYIDDIALTDADYARLGALNEPERSRILFRRAMDDIRSDPIRYVRLCAAPTPILRPVRRDEPEDPQSSLPGGPPRPDARRGTRPARHAARPATAARPDAADGRPHHSVPRPDDHLSTVPHPARTTDGPVGRGRPGVLESAGERNSCPALQPEPFSPGAPPRRRRRGRDRPACR